MTLTLKGCFRSFALVSVKLMKNDWITGQAVKARKRMQNGRASTHAALVSARRPRPAGPPEGRAEPCRVDPLPGPLGRPAGTGVTGPAGDPVMPVWADMALLTRPDGVRLLLHRLEGGRRVSARLRHLLQLGVEVRHDLLPGRERRRGLGRLELLAEDGELLVGRELGVLPGALDRGQVRRHRVPLRLHV